MSGRPCTLLCRADYEIEVSGRQKNFPSFLLFSGEVEEQAAPSRSVAFHPSILSSRDEKMRSLARGGFEEIVMEVRSAKARASERDCKKEKEDL